MLMWLLQLLGLCALPVSNWSGAPNTEQLVMEYLKGSSPLTFQPQRSRESRSFFLHTKTQFGDYINQIVSP